MASAQMFVLDPDTGEWVAWSGSSGGGGSASVNVSGGTLDEVTLVAAVTSITNPVVTNLSALLTTGPDVFGQLRASSAANLSGLSATFPGGALMTTRPGDWVEFSDPGAATLATATRLAVATRSHVVTSITGSILAVNAQTGLTMRLVEDIGGTPVIRWATKFLPPTGQGRDFTLTGLNILCNVGVSVSVTFSAAPAAGNFESCALTGYTI